jgi:hypothetical protein
MPEKAYKYKLSSRKTSENFVAGLFTETCLLLLV